MKKSKKYGLLALTAVAVLSLAACSGGGKKGDKAKENKSIEKVDMESFPLAVSNKEKPIEGGTLDVAVVTDSQFQGLFLWELYSDNTDLQFMTPSHEPLFTMDKDFKITNDGVAKLDIDKDKNIATVTLQKEAVWSDGEPVTIEDVIYPYEIIGHKDYTGVRYDNRYTNIVGMDDYHSGKADTISGIKKVDDKTMTVEFKEMNPSMLQVDGGLSGNAAPKHVLKDIPVKDLESSDAVRKNPVTFGPYVMDKIKPGESVVYVPNKHYYGEKPKMDKLVFSTAQPASIVEALKSKKYDIALKVPTDMYPTFKDVEGYEILGREELSYTYIGFKQGKWDKEHDEVVTDSKAKMADKNLRQAMGYAVDNNVVGSQFYNGLRSNATTLIPPIFKTFHNSELKGYTQDKDKAKKLLADAGYKDVDGDGLVEDKDGKELVIKFASMSGGETAQPLAEYYMQEWKDIGLNVELTGGRLLDMQSFYDKLKNDDPEIDVYQGAWGVGEDPSPSGLYGRNAQFNYTRFASEENDKLLANIDSEKSFDADFRKKAFDEWQAYAVDEAFVIPTLYRNEVLPVSSRVTGFDWDPQLRSNELWSKVGVTAEKR
ncbi:oligopeptide ABC transporter substrate-binding protein [Vagococcus intermedius]|uniref:Oligopeptide ABC transporter substrate-binding protein n=1 Tax=Vagococcus intermedius TaxID=2991418 RepID=A0AAF0I7N7_9ENTE|nr:oligopeptide ABC transporter substrate-binding protein [Vagococcus intermedius]WEG73156.1 oligopeptide ABC transporter substrate-binding protein [Vagococcus intermedius]WEG75240.1 oligopeptide ABC transporter substrate-binding protein [Vagococcus intermedius]